MNIQQQIESIGDKIYEAIVINPMGGVLIIAVIFLLLFIGVILDWDWVVKDPPNSRMNWFWSFGRPVVRIYLGISFFLGMITMIFCYIMFS